MLAHFGHHLLAGLLTPLLPFIRDDFVLDYTQAGWVISAFSLSYGISQLPAGWLADRISPRILIAIGISGTALFGLLVGLSPTYVIMVIFLVLLGVAGGGYHPASAPLVSASVEPKNRGRALGIHQMGGSASLFIVPLVTAASATAWGWRGSFIALAVPTMVFGIVLYVLLGRQMAVKKVEPEITNSLGGTPSPPGNLRRLVPFFFLSTFNHAVVLAVISFIPLYLVDHFGVSEGAAAALLALVFSGGLWASPLGGYLSDRLGRVRVVLVVCLIAGPAVYLLNLVPYGLGIGVILLIIGMCMHIWMPVSEAYILGQTSERRRSTILGLYYSARIEGGGVLTPVMGYLIDRLGFHSSFTIASAAVVVVTLVCSVWLWSSRD